MSTQSVVDAVLIQSELQFCAVLAAVEANDSYETRRSLGRWRHKQIERLQFMLSMAIKHGNVDIVNMLLGCGFDYSNPIPNIAFDFAIENLVDAALQGSIPIFEIMLHHGWNVNQNLHGAGDALSLALRWHETGDAACWLLEHGAEPDGHYRRLLQGGADPDSCARSSLELACGQLSTSTHTIRLLLQKGALVIGTGALHAAATSNYVEALDILIEEGGADINATRTKAGVRGVTALHCAAGAGCVDSVQFLLNMGASKEKRNSLGQTPKETAEHLEQLECAAALEH